MTPSCRSLVAANHGDPNSLKHLLVGRLLQGMETAWTRTNLIQLLCPCIFQIIFGLFFIVGLQICLCEVE